MDIFEATVSIATETYNVSIFIQAFIPDVRSYGSATQEIRERLEREVLFLESFKTLFFEKEGALSRYEDLPAILTHDVRNILTGLRKSLAEYGLLAVKHGLILAEPRASSSLDRADPMELSESNGFRNDLKVKMKEIKKNIAPVDWALFDKDKINKVLAEYAEETRRLRQVMELMLLTLAAFGGISRQDLARSKDAANLRLQKAAQRQLRVESLPPVAYGALSGQLINIPLNDSRDIGPYIDEYLDPNGFGSTKVVVETRYYNDALALATEEEDEGTVTLLKEPIRSLAWLLSGSSLVSDTDQYESSMSTLHCIGFLDQPDNYRSMLLYQLPQSSISDSDVQTLYQFINGTDVSELPKPLLGDRFFLAYTLASTVFSLHSSGWVHKNIWPHGILIFPSATEHMRMTPYLVGWGLARRLEVGTELKEDLMLEPNIYRHPLRYEEPRTPYVNIHDIYALGVVLLEIGLWRTMSHLFSSAIAKSRVIGKLPPVQLKHEKLMEYARSLRLKQEMGAKYAKAVERCLCGDFEVEDDDRRGIALSVQFRALVIDVLASGISL